MLQQLKVLLKTHEEEQSYLKNYIRQSFKNCGKELIIESIRDLFHHHSIIEFQRLKQLMLENGCCFDNNELRIFFKCYFGGDKGDVERFAAMLGSETKGYISEPRKYDKMQVGYYVLQSLIKMVRFSNKIHEIKREFKQRFDIQKIRQLVVSEEEVCPQKIKSYTSRELLHISYILSQLKLLNLVRKQQLYQFFDQPLILKPAVVDAPQSVKKASKAQKVARYMRLCMQGSEEIQNQKEKLILGTRVSYQNIFLLFSSSLNKEASINQCINRYSQYSDTNVKNVLQRVVLRYANSLNLSLNSIRAWLQPRNQTFKNILSKRSLCTLNSSQLSSTLKLLQNIFQLEIRLMNEKVQIQCLKSVYRQIDTSNKGTITLDNIQSFLLSSQIKSTHRGLMHLMHRFTPSYSSTSINYTQFLTQLKYP